MLTSESEESLMPTSTIRLTVAQAVITYLSRQYSVTDGERRRLIPATLGIFGHGNVAGLGQALDQLADVMPFIQGRNEQALVHAAVGYAKHSRRRTTLAVTASIGPGAMNLITGAALATVNRLPVLLLPGDTYATRHQGPVLQQLQHPVDADLTVNDAFRPISRFFDRITRPEQLLTALPGRHAGPGRPGHRRARWCCPCRRTCSPTPTTTRPSSSPSGTGPSAGPPPPGRDRFGRRAARRRRRSR